MNDHPLRYVLDWELCPRRSDLVRFLVDQMAEAGADTMTPELGSVLVGILEERGLLEADERKIYLPILDRCAWDELAGEAQIQLADEQMRLDSRPIRAPRLRATPPGG